MGKEDVNRMNKKDLYVELELRDKTIEQLSSTCERLETENKKLEETAAIYKLAGKEAREAQAKKSEEMLILLKVGHISN